MATKFQYVDENNDVLTTDDVKTAGNYKAMGYREAAPQDINRDQIKQHYSGAWNTAKAFGVGALSQVPGFQTVNEWMQPKLPGTNTPVEDTANNLAAAHPVAFGAGEVAGGTAAFVTGEGALVDAGMEGASLLAQASRGAVTNTLLGTAHRVDTAIMAHAVSPGGDEHIWADLGLGALSDAAIGAAVPLPGAAIKGAGKALGLIGKAADGMSTVETRQAVVNYNKVSDALEYARKDDMAAMFEQKGFDKMSVPDIKAKIKSRLPDLEAEYNEIKANAKIPMTANQMGPLADRVGDIYGQEWGKEGAELVNEISMKPQWSVEELHNLRQRIDAKIDYTSNDPSSLDRAHWEARNEVSKSIHNTLRANDMITQGARADAWIATDKEYSNLMAIDKAVEYKTVGGKIPGLEFLQKAKPVVKLLKWTLGIKGYMGAFVGGEAFNAALKTAEKFQGGEYRTSAKALARIFNNTADKMSTAAQSGLYGAPQAAASLANVTLNHSHYEDLQAKTNWIVANPQVAASNMSAHMDKMGADSETNQKMAERAVTMHQYLANAMPKNPQANSIMATHAFIPEDKKREWIDMANVAHDPTHALTNPTPKNMAFYKTFYPEMYAQTQAAVIQQLQNNHDLPLEGRVWASRVLGQPIDNLTNPLLWNLLEQGRQMKAMQQQRAQAQAQEGQKSGNSGSGAVDSNSTSLQHLQGKQ